MAKRKKIADSITAQVAERARRRCAMCFALDNNPLQRDGQIAHIDHNADNNDPENLIWLCLRHHNDYDTRQSQGKSYTPCELKKYQSLLDSYLRSGIPETWRAYQLPSESESMSNSEAETVRTRVSPEIYDRRLPIYQACEVFMLKVVQEGKVSWDDIADFARKTEQARFICGPEIGAYLDVVFRKAHDLRFLNWRVETSDNCPDAERQKIVGEEFEVFNWFAREMGPMRTRFSMVMTLRDE